MLNNQVQPSSIDGIKRLANQIKKATGVPLHKALDQAARAGSFQNYANAYNALQQPSDHTAYITVYWLDQEQRWSIGREILTVRLSMPLNQLVTKSELRILRGFGWGGRLVAPDHFVNDHVYPSQQSARDRACMAARSLQFMDTTGLKPSDDRQKFHSVCDSQSKLPGLDHSTRWYDPVSQTSLVVDEPYGGDEGLILAERKSWSERSGWKIVKIEWPGIYFPNSANMFFVAPHEAASDIERLKQAVESSPHPVTSSKWTGQSDSTHDVFVSPLCGQQRKDLRRSQSRGTVYRLPSAKTLPCGDGVLGLKRRPVDRMKLENHDEVGRLLKSLIHRSRPQYPIGMTANSIRSELENWLALEFRERELAGRDLLDFYYGDISMEDPVYVGAESLEGKIAHVVRIKTILESSYSDCAPRRKMLAKVGSLDRQLRRLV